MMMMILFSTKAKNKTKIMKRRESEKYKSALVWKSSLLKAVFKNCCLGHSPEI